MDYKQAMSDLEWLRSSIIGRNILFNTPFGKRPLVYADYTASGRGIDFIEDYVKYLLNYYANSHTDDDFTGKAATNLLHEASDRVKKFVNAGESGKLIFTGSGATGAVTKLQQILGVFLPQVTGLNLKSFMECKKITPPVVFVGPYEHHSNEIMWRQGLCEVVEIPLNDKGVLCLESLEKIISDPIYKDRKKIGSFSAGSNVSGITTKVYDVARIMHKHDGIVCFDFAASAPYVEINMNKDSESYFDAVFFSPHKFLGGPGSSGVLVFNQNIYRTEVPPTVAGGGTVDFVTYDKEVYCQDIETRETPGTPGILQGIRTSLAMQLKERVGVETIEAIEHGLYGEFLERFKSRKDLTIYGPADPAGKINIVAFNIIHKDRILHPKFVTKLMNDLFGIQTRAGCSCAGPYGHTLLSIGKELSDQYVDTIQKLKIYGMKPGWVRLNLHWAFSADEFNYIMDALEFCFNHAHKFLSLYRFDLNSGEWTHQCDAKNLNPVDLDMDSVIGGMTPLRCSDCTEPQMYREMMERANGALEHLRGEMEYVLYDDEIEELMFFYTPKKLA
ncbi:MAG: aminotransferase class V-fold PLP-dependent enzyme [Bacteriovoracaceae bacterium]|nr:aminotransferase class V-fold PLP-dependent enzyme [Bacteriovoracaceae bacterium]